MNALYCQIGELIYHIKTEEELLIQPQFSQFIYKNPENINGRKEKMLIEASFSRVEVLTPFEGELIFQNPERLIYTKDGMESRQFRLPGGDVYGSTTQVGERELCIELLEDRIPRVEVSYWFFEMLMLEKFLLQKESLILHSSFISYQGKGIVFTAPSGTGKSTQADLWVKYVGARLINGDRSILRFDREKGQIYAEGLPFCGSSRTNENESCPLAAIVFLAQGKENQAHPISPFYAINRIFGECSINSWNINFVDQSLNLISEMIGHVGTVDYACNMEAQAVTVLKEYIKIENTY